MTKFYYLLLLIPSLLFAQDYHKKWDKILSLEEDGKIKSASKIVDRIYGKAKSNNNEAQVIKAFLYRSKYLVTLDANAQTTIVNQLRSEIKIAPIPSKALLNLIYAQCLTNYHSRKGWNLKTFQSESLPEDFTNWTRLDLKSEIETAYALSLEKRDSLKKFKLSNYEQIFDFANGINAKNVTLLDYVLRENINYLTTQNLSREKAASDEYIKNQLTADNKTFTTANFSKIGGITERYLQLLQQREASDPSLRNTFERIKSISTYLLTRDKSYVHTLEHLQKQTTDTKLLADILIEKADVYKNAASMEFPDFNEKALHILDSIILLPGRLNAQAFAIKWKEQLLLKNLEISMKTTLYPSEKTRASVTFKNIQQIKISYFKIGTKTANRIEKNLGNSDSLILATMSGNPVYTMAKLLPAAHDYFQHSTEIMLPQLGTGNYLAVFESDSHNPKYPIARTHKIIQVSNLTLFETSRDNRQIFTVIDRKSGKAIQGAKVTVDQIDLISDKNGNAITPAPDLYAQKKVVVTFNGDTLTTEYQTYRRSDSRSNSQKKYGKCDIFLDRAIYRPGQAAYYKGVLLKKSAGKTAVVTDTSVGISVKNASREEIFTTTAKTNEFGSFSGEFTIPLSGLTGSYTIEVNEPEDYDNDSIYDKSNENHPFWDEVDYLDHANQSFLVEEYKRAKFHVAFNPVSKNYTIGQEVVATGNAKSYSGSSLSGATVKYTIKRSSGDALDFDFEPVNRVYYGDEETIAHDSTATDNLGNFKIIFMAHRIEDEDDEDMSQLPIYHYKINVDVTDVNGETHSSETSVYVGHHLLNLSAYVTNVTDKKRAKLFVSSLNLNDYPTPTRGKIEFYLVKAAATKFKERTFPKPEIALLSDDEFEKEFPFEENTPQIDYDFKGNLQKTITVTAAAPKEIMADLTDIPYGKYRVVFKAVDANGCEMNSVSDFDFVDRESKINPSELFSIRAPEKYIQKQKHLEVRLSSPVADLQIRLQAAHGQHLIYDELIDLKNHESVIRIPLSPDFFETVTVVANCYYDNFASSSKTTSNLETVAPNLELTASTFRSLIEPGSHENWSFHLSAKNTKLHSEILASMYDASLDQFSRSEWRQYGFRDYYRDFYSNMQLLDGRTDHFSMAHLNNGKPMRELQTERTELIWFGFNFMSEKQKSDKLYRSQIAKKARPENALSIYGIVSDESGPLPSAIITVKGTRRFVYSDTDGYFTIDAAPGEVLVFSFVGMTDAVIEVGSDNEINITLASNGEMLGEVIVTSAMGIRKGQNAVTASSVVMNEELTLRRGRNVEHALKGMVAGIQIETSQDSVIPTMRVVLRGNKSIEGALIVIDGVVSSESDLAKLSGNDIVDAKAFKATQAIALYGPEAKNGVIIITTKKTFDGLSEVKTRTNLKETAFFFPHLNTDDSGNINVRFTSPEAMTQWRLRLLAHNKSGVSTQLEKTVVTQKSLMVVPNFPRFLREKDTIVISAKISNMTAKTLSGTAMLQLFDATTMKPVDVAALNSKNAKSFGIPASGNTAVNWKIYVPENLQGLHYRIVAKAAEFSDGEENILPVLTNNLLVTETLPIWVREKSKKEFVFENLRNNSSKTMKPHRLTLEYSSNPTWLALQSLPYLIEYEHECAEQTFSRYYANALASTVINSSPKIAAVLDDCRKNGKSKLERNDELKNILLAETPWINDALPESEQKKRLAMLLDFDKMKSGQESALSKLKKKQLPSGGFSWFDGGNENDYITRHIVAGLGHLKKLGVTENESDSKQMTEKAVANLDSKFLEWQNSISPATQKRYLSNRVDLHYLYARSFFAEEFPISDSVKKFANIGLQQLKTSWLNLSLYEKGMAALVCHRFGDEALAKKILESLKETSANDEETGMHWIENKYGWYWYQAPIETQALLIEAFSEIGNDVKAVEAMKVWLIYNKKQNNWPTTKATAEAVYALLLQGRDWLDVKDNVTFRVGNEKIASQKLSETDKEAQTGYIKINWPGAEINKEMATLSVDNKTIVPGFGGFYFQYFEDLDQIKSPSGNAIRISKALIGNDGKPITSSDKLKIGDLITVRLAITVTEDLEFVHLKDMRASCFEPVDVISGYKWDRNIGYYKSTRDAATHFFFDAMPKGAYEFEYQMHVNNQGEFSNGITTLQSMYAPEFSGHTKGIRVNVK